MVLKFSGLLNINSKAFNGYNLTDGGDGGRGLLPTKEMHDKISAKLKGRPAHNKGVKATEETCAKIAVAQKLVWARKKLESQNNS